MRPSNLRSETTKINRMKNLWKYSGIYIWASGLLHIIVGIITGLEGWKGILRHGVVNGSTVDLGTSLAFWFTISGMFIVMLGLVVQHCIRATGQPAPKFLGWWLLVFAVVACIVAPVSGGWLFLPQAWIIIAANRLRN